MGVIFFVYNAVFSTILILIVLVASIIAIVAKNPDTRYQPMRDDRNSFIKSQTQLTTELDALGATARGESKHGGYGGGGKLGREGSDEDSWSGGSGSDQRVPQSMAYGGRGGEGRPPSQGYYPSARPQQPAGRAAASPWQRGAGYE